MKNMCIAAPAQIVKIDREANVLYADFGGARQAAKMDLLPDVEIGDNTVISYNSSVTHNTVIGNNSYVALGAMIGAYVNIGNNVFIGIGVNVISGKVDYIGDNSYIGAGSLLTKSIEKNSLVAGSPARVIRHLDEEK